MISLPKSVAGKMPRHPVGPSGRIVSIMDFTGLQIGAKDSGIALSIILVPTVTHAPKFLSILSTLQVRISPRTRDLMVVEIVCPKRRMRSKNTK